VVKTGLDRLIAEQTLQDRIQGRIGYLCHSASVDAQARHGVQGLKHLFGSRFRAIFAPQHGFATDAQDNMIESPHFFHSYFQVPVYSLYSETRIPTPEMLADIDTLIVDLQDNGTRVYTYVWTMVLAMEACGHAGVKVVVLDRPNPLGGDRLGGNILDLNYRSIIGWNRLPMQYAMTIGEVALFARRFWDISVDLEVIPMTGWNREMKYVQTELPWVLPSPNFPTPDTAQVYPGTVLIEGTNLSEGRGTTRPFELIGHPNLDAYEFADYFHDQLQKKLSYTGAVIRPATFQPTFDKHAGIPCNGFQVHVLQPRLFQAWNFGQVLLQALYHFMGSDFAWRQPPFEYVHDKLPIDLLNGSEVPRQWVEQQGTFHDLLMFAHTGYLDFLAKRKEVLLYN
jgi:uncharacterized protein YbbC (DUF1343 family)